MNQLQGDVRIFIEGSGAETKYYAQAGADAASKKLLGNDIKVKHDFVTITSPNTVTISVDGKVFAALTHSSSGHDSICFIKEDGSLYAHPYYAFPSNTIDSFNNGNVHIINNQSGTYAFEYLIFYK